MSPTVLTKDGTTGRWTFPSREEFLSFLSNPDNRWHGLESRPRSPCSQGPLGWSVSTLGLISDISDEFIRMGFPCLEAEVFLWGLAHCLACDAKIHRTSTEWPCYRFYNDWHLWLWEEYLRAHAMSDACAEQEPPLRGMVDWDTEVMRLKGNKTRRTKGKTIYCHENAEVIPPEDPPVKPASRNTKASPKQRNPITPDEKPPMKTRCSGACVHASQTGSQLDSCHIRVYFYDDEWFPRKSLSVLQSIKATYPGNITFEKIKTPRPGSRRSDKPKHGFASDNEPTFEVIPNSDIRALRAMLQKLTQRIDEDSRSLKPGAIYGFSRPDAPGYIKIGTTGPDNAEKRVRTIGQSCGFTPKLLFSAEMPCAAGIIESLIHLQLHENRRRNIFCTQKCTTQHDEWFDISETEAIKQVARWLAFSHSMPYVGNILKRFWKDMVEEVRAVLRDDSTPEKWVALMIDAIPLEKEEENRIRVTEVRFAIRIRAEGECSSLQVIQQGGFGDKVLTTVPLLMDT